MAMRTFIVSSVIAHQLLQTRRPCPSGPPAPLASSLGSFTVSGVAGFVTGTAIRVIGKTLVVVVGCSMLLVQYGAARGYLTLHPDRIETDTPHLQRLVHRVSEAVSQQLDTSASGFSAGFVTALSR